MIDILDIVNNASYKMLADNNPTSALIDQLDSVASLVLEAQQAKAKLNKAIVKQLADGGHYELLSFNSKDVRKHFIGGKKA